MKLSKNFNLLIGVIAFVLSIVNSLTYAVDLIALPLAIIETLVILFLAISGRIKEFIIFYLLFSSTTIESSLFTLRSHSYDRYSFFHLPIIAYYHLFFLIFGLYIFVRLSGKKYKFNNARDLSLITIFVLGFAMTTVSYVVNDNGVADISGMLRFSIIDAYETVWVLFYSLLILFAFDNYVGFREKLKDVSVKILVGSSLAGVFLFLIGNFSEWTSATRFLICPLIFFFSPALILLSFEKKNWLFYYFLGIICTIIQLYYSVGIPGAFWLYLFFVVVVFYCKLFRNIKKVIKKPVLFVSSLMIIIIVPFALTFLTSLDPNSNYVSFKLNKFLDMISINGGFDKWYNSLGDSIGIRIEQVVNIFIELGKKPWAFIFGKGYGGTTLHYWGIYNWNDYGSTYPDLQINSQVFSSFLTGIVEIIINFGIIGIAFLVLVAKNSIVQLFRKKGSWMYVIGAFWLLIFLYFYNSMFLGLVWFCIGINEISSSKKIVLNQQRFFDKQTSSYLVFAKDWRSDHK